MRSLLLGTSINTFFGRITALRGTRNLALYLMLSRLLRSVCLWRQGRDEKAGTWRASPFTLCLPAYWLIAPILQLQLLRLVVMPFTGRKLGKPSAGLRVMLHPKLCIYSSALFIAVLLPPLANAEIVPEKSPYDSRMRMINYNRMDVVKLSTFYGVSTHVEFGENEVIRDVAIGDDQAWSIVPRGNHLFIKPKATKADTNVTVVTDKHVYNFALVVQPRSVNDTSAWKDPNLVYGVSFRYPEQEAAKLAAEQAEKAKAIAEKRRLESMKDKLAKATKDGVDMAGGMTKSLEAQNYNYWMAGSSEISPTAARDDGRFTYLSFSNNRDMPAVYSVDTFGAEALINTSVEGNTIIIHRVVPKLRLRKGGAVVCIRNDAFNANGGHDNVDGTISPDVERVIKGGR